MSYDLAGLRTRIKDALTAADFFAFSTVPDNAMPPMVYVAPADPYVTPEGASLGGVIVRHQLIAVASPGVNETRADELDDMVSRAIDVLDVLVEQGIAGTYEVGRPGGITLGGQPYLGVAIDIQTEIQRSEA